MRLQLVVATGMLLSTSAYADDAACIAASEQALTLRQEGKFHEALKQLASCADRACPAEVSAECAKRVEEVRAATPTVVFAVKDRAGKDVVDASVSMDGALLAPKLDGLPLSIDPGKHSFRFEMSGQPATETTLVLREGEHDRRENVIVGAPMTNAVVVAKSSWSMAKTFALLSGAVGLVGIGLGATFGGFAVAAKNQQNGDCVLGNCPRYAQSVADYNTGQQNATASTVLFTVGAAFLATAVVLWIVAPKRSTTTALRSFVIEGAF